jgi:Spy/CpxP family protein refolding chaperone
MKSARCIIWMFSFIFVVSLTALAQKPGAIFLAQVPDGPMGMGPMGPGPHVIMHHGPFGAWWKNSDVVKELQLTDAQVKQIEQTFLDYRLKLIDLRADVERQETKLQPLLEADQPNEQQVSSQVDAVLAARAKLEKTSTMMMLAVRHVLSVDQWKKLQTIEHRHAERNVFYRRMGPGGHEEHMHGPDRSDAPPPPDVPLPPDAQGTAGDK